MIQFPKDFFWGAATSSYQVEGNNRNADWWEWEKKAGKERSGAACRHYELFTQDFDFARQLNHNCHRLSIEWSRIEPQEGNFSGAEIKHYQDVILALRERGIEPIVTLHHYTLPIWLAESGGWLNKESDRYFLRYVGKIIDALADKVRFWVTINEPNVYVYYSYILGTWPPQERSYSKAGKAKEKLLNAHVGAYRLIRDIYKRKNLPFPYISLAESLQAFVPCGRSLKNRLAAYLRERWFNFGPIERLIRCKALDFIGVNYYTRQLVDVEGWGLKHFTLDVCAKNHDPRKKNSLGWEIYPEGLYYLLLKLKKYNLPVFILENGICADDDNLRWEYILEHLKNIKLAMDKGVRVLGYLYWSLLDNFEWDKGFSARFGLIDVDYNTYKRSVRESARKFAQVCYSGILENE